MTDLSNIKIGVVGLGYVGLPLAVEFSKKFEVVGFDINKARIEALKNNTDVTLELSAEQMNSAGNITYSSDTEDLKKCNFYVVSVPTPIDIYKKPDLSPVIGASKTVGSVLKKGDIVVYESTVYPGCTEEDCVPVLEKISGLKFNSDFFCGYSPERINPGDKEHTVSKIKKITSGSTPEIAEIVNDVYSSIIVAGTHKASSIKVAEAAKVIENSQRDINIAFVNELALIFEKMGIDTNEVLEAAGTKWNFLNFKPGLVGGHCIGVDPYYLTYKAEGLGYNSEIILAGRRLNDNMPVYIASKIVKLMIKKGLKVSGAKVLVAGITFKENCPDIRNSKAVDVVKELQEYGCDVDVYDPWAVPSEVESFYGFTSFRDCPVEKYDSVVILAAHKQFKDIDFVKFCNNSHVIYDMKGILNKEIVDGRL